MDNAPEHDAFPPRRTLKVELDFLADALDDPDFRTSYLDLENGEVWLGLVLENGVGPDGYDPDEYDGLDDFDPERYLPIPGEGSRAAYHDMVDFIDTLADTALADRLREAIRGKGAFRRFGDTLARGDAAEFTRWHGFRDEARLARARSWLAAQGIAEPG